MDKFCSFHNIKVISVCFYKGCLQPLLCRKCFREHPVDHDLESDVQELSDLMTNDKWIQKIEDEKEQQIASIENIFQQKENLGIKNKKMIKEWISTTIDVLKKKEIQWVNELSDLMKLDKNQARQEIFLKLEEYIQTLKSYTLREDIFEKVNKVKAFKEDLIPNSTELVEQAQTYLKEWTLDKFKMEKYKEDMTKILKKINLQSLFPLEPFESLLDIDKLTGLQEEYLNYKRDKSLEIERLKQDMEKLLIEKEQLIEKINSLVNTNSELEDKLNKLENFVPSLALNEDSRIINPEHHSYLASWLPRPMNSEQRCKLTLLYRGSRDGFIASSFHAKCDNTTPTISILKSKEHGRIFGGFTTKSWKHQDNYTEDKEAFLFSLTHKEKYPCKNPEYAIYPGYMCTFGGGNDLYINDNCNVNNSSYSYFPYSYECSKFSSYDDPNAQSYLAGSYNFLVEEIEVYQITWS